MKRDFSFGVAALLTFGLFASQALAQSFCNVTGHTGTNTGPITASFKQGTIGDSHYEQWYDQGNNSSTFYSDGSFTCSFSNTKDYLCRSGKSYDKTKTWDQLGHLYADFSVKMNKNSFSNVGYSFIGIYGWTVQPLVEFYIVDNWGSQYRPGGSSWGWTHKGTVTVDGGTYDIYYHRQINQPAIEGGNTDFDQYYSVRQEPRSCGTIDISAHFEAWSKVPGWKLGKMYEAKVLGEAGNGNGGASGSFDFNYAKVYVSNTSPNSSSSTVQSSASQNLPVVGEFPGTIEFEDFQASNNEFNNYGSFIGGINPGTWVEFKVDVKQTGTYDFDLLAACGLSSASTVNLSLDGTAIGSADVMTADWDTYETFSGTTPSLTAGEHTLRVTFTGGYVNADKITFTKKGTTSSSSATKPSSSSVAPSSSSVVPSSSSVVPSSSSVVPPSSSSVPVVVVNLPGSIEFENYQNSGGDFKTNANSLGNINPGSWVEYSVNFTSAGYYDFEVLAAREDKDGNKSYLTVAVDGEDIGMVTDILTTSWTDYLPFSGTSTKEIAAGEHTLRVTFDYGWIDPDKITFTKKEESSSSVVPSSSSVVPSSSSVVPPSSSSVVPSSSSVVPPSSSSVVPSSSSVVPPSSSSVKPSSSSVEPPSSSSSEVPPSSSTIEPPPSSSSVVPSSSSVVTLSSSSVIPPSSSSIELPPSSSSEVIASSETVVPPSSASITPLSSATEVVLFSSSSFSTDSTVLDSTIMNNNGPVQLVYGPVVQMDPVVDQGTDAIGNIRMTLSDRNVQVFDVQGRNLGLVRVSAGTSLEDALFAKFHRPGIYLVKQGSRMMKVRVSR